MPTPIEIVEAEAMKLPPIERADLAEDRILRIGFSNALFSFPMAPRTRLSTRVCRSLKVAQDG